MSMARDGISSRRRPCRDRVAARLSVRPAEATCHPRARDARNAFARASAERGRYQQVSYEER